MLKTFLKTRQDLVCNKDNQRGCDKVGATKITRRDSNGVVYKAVRDVVEKTFGGSRRECLDDMYRCAEVWKRVSDTEYATPRSRKTIDGVLCLLCNTYPIPGVPFDVIPIIFYGFDAGRRGVVDDTSLVNFLNMLLSAQVRIIMRKATASKYGTSCLSSQNSVATCKKPRDRASDADAANVLSEIVSE